MQDIERLIARLTTVHGCYCGAKEVQHCLCVAAHWPTKEVLEAVSIIKQQNDKLKEIEKRVEDCVSRACCLEDLITKE